MANRDRDNNSHKEMYIPQELAEKWILVVSPQGKKRRVPYREYLKLTGAN